MPLRSRPRFSHLVARIFALAFLAPLLGCLDKFPTTLGPMDGTDFAESGRRASATAGTAPGVGFYPLAVGNQWHYSRVFTLDFHGYGSDTIRTSVDVVNIGAETWQNQAYLVEEETATQDSRPGEVFRSWMRYRQDRVGFYYRDVCTCEPPVMDQGLRRSAPILAAASEPARGTNYAVLVRQVPAGKRDAFVRSRTELETRMERMRRALRASADAAIRSSSRPGGVEPGEVALLRYPLHVGASWQIRPDLDLFWTIAGVELLATPAGKFPAYRIDVTIPGAGPEDFATVWIGRSGRLAQRIHVVVTEGYPEAGWTGDETEVVDRVSISR